MSKKGKTKGKAAKDEDGDERDALAFKVLSTEQTNALMALDVIEMQNKLKDIFNLEKHYVDLTQAAVLDCYTSAVYWGVQQKFTAQQLSGFFTIIHILLDNVKEKHMSMVDNSVEFKKLFVGLGVDDIKSSGLDFFSVEQAKSITDYVYNCFFQHYKLYLYMFTHSQAEEIIGTDLDVEVAKAANVPHPPPLDEGVSEDMYRDYIATPPPTPSPELKEADETRPSRASSRGNDTPKSRGGTPKRKGSAPKSRGSSRSGSSRLSMRKQKVPEEEMQDPARELEDTVAQSDFFTQLTPDDVREVVESVAKEMLGSLQTEIASKLRDKETQIIQRINKIHKIAE